MTEEVLSVLTNEVLMALGQCKPEEIFTFQELVKWARTKYPEQVFRSYDLENWAEENGWIDEDSNPPDSYRVVKENGSPSELLWFVQSLDKEMGCWEFTSMLRDWAVSEMAKHELVTH